MIFCTFSCAESISFLFFLRNQLCRTVFIVFIQTRKTQGVAVGFHFRALDSLSWNLYKLFLTCSLVLERTRAFNFTRRLQPLVLIVGWLPGWSWIVFSSPSSATLVSPGGLRMPSEPSLWTSQPRKSSSHEQHLLEKAWRLEANLALGEGQGTGAGQLCVTHTCGAWSLGESGGPAFPNDSGLQTTFCSTP